MKVTDYIPPNQFRYYYTTLNKIEKNIYDTLVSNFLSFSEIFVVHSGVSIDRIFIIFYYIKYDIPELFYVKNIELNYLNNLTKEYRIYPYYRFNNDKVCSMLHDMEMRYKRFIEINIGKSEIEREQIIHDVLSSSVKYNDMDKPYSHEAPGALLYDIGVCEGISKATKWLCDRLNLKCVVAIGNITSKEIEEPHAWNIIWIDSVPYHMDITYDIGVSGYGLRYDYFNLSDYEMYADRVQEEKYPLPNCNKSHNWYMDHLLFFRTKSELVNRIKNLSGQKVFSFQLPLFSEKRDEVRDIVNLLISQNINTSKYRNKSYRMYYNYKRMVFEVVFSQVQQTVVFNTENIKHY